MTWLGVGNVQGVLMRANCEEWKWAGVASSPSGRGPAPNCLPFKLQCYRSRRGTHFSLQPMEFRSDFSATLSSREIRRGRQTGFSSRIAAEMMMRLVLVSRLTGINHEDRDSTQGEAARGF